MRKQKQRERWQDRAEALKKDEMARLRWKVLRTFGLLPTEKCARRLRREDVILCALHLYLDMEERQRQLCPACREEERTFCLRCGEALSEENPQFDRERFEELKNRGKLR